MKIIDAHIHLDRYKNQEIKHILDNSDLIEALVSVSFELESCKQNLLLARKYDKVKPAFGYHPEQTLPSEEEVSRLIDWIIQHQAEMTAVGEVGLPYYLRQEQKVSRSQYKQYIDILEAFIQLAKKLDKPVVLHAVYDDAPVVCDLLEKHSVKKAHFHWFKGDEKTIKRMSANGYYVSVTPEIVYKEKIQKLVQSYPVEQLMVETDGPWQFEGPFLGKRTHPNMMMHSICAISEIERLSEKEISEIILKNTKRFYMI